MSDWAPSEEQVRAMRAKWRGDIGAAAKDVEKRIPAPGEVER